MKFNYSYFLHGYQYIKIRFQHSEKFKIIHELNQNFFLNQFHFFNFIKILDFTILIVILF
jgi:hypothetical protein